MGALNVLLFLLYMALRTMLPMGMFSTFASRQNDGEPPEIDQSFMREAEYLHIIRQGINGAPRSNMGPKHIGPSQIGTTCTIALIHMLVGTAHFDGGDRWAATIGQAVHAWLEATFGKYGPPGRFLPEVPVVVGVVDGKEIRGTCDLFDIEYGNVVDWKVVGPTQLLNYRNQIKEQYRIQIHLYARGLVLAGYDVRTVTIAFLPRQGELGTGELSPWPTKVFTRPGKRYFFTEPYDEAIALKALSRLQGLADLLKLMSPEQLIDLYPPCTEFFCPWCSRVYRP